VTRAKKKSATKRPDFAQFLVVGWREWISLPDLGISMIKAKVDTGARTSAIHAYDITNHRHRGRDFLTFKVHPIQRNQKKVVVCSAPLVDERMVRSSSGHASLRPVIETTIEVGPIAWKIELTLTNRDEMGFRMLLGRQAVRDHLLVHAGKSYLISSR
jgi:hypothetical protein